MTVPAVLSLTSIDVATSSSDLAWQAAAEGAPAGTAFLVGEQTAGRGRRGTGWSSARGGMYL
ncbi:MAG: biotin--[acetyl-CoA-carboxylase] ligase, partial [Candidatus Puniceispirillaceae bacterium]